MFEVYYHTTTLLLPVRGEEETETPECSVSGRIIDLKRVNYPLVQQWMKTCNTNHGDACHSQSQAQISAFKVIDSTTRQILAAASGCKYLALSYLWGKQKPAEKQQVSCQDKLAGHIPRVVEDAITVARELDIPYVWVDKYCIDQADKSEKHQVIRQMDQIYHDATITIIAAAGNDAEYGLPGVSDLSRDEQVSIDIGNQKYLVFPDSTRELRQSMWSTRAWTYQEALLSRRRLIFTNTQAYFQCMEMHCWEGLKAPPEALQKMKYYQCFPDDGIGKDPRDIVTRLNEYASRQLTYQSDILNAFLGIFRPYQQKEIFHFWGIPFLVGSETDTSKSFASALGWTTRLPDRATRRASFPSWSWAGWGDLDNLVIPWETDGLSVFKNPTADVEIEITDCAGNTIPLIEYVRHLQDGADFSDFPPKVYLTGQASRCGVESPWKIDYNLPPELTSLYAVATVRLMAVPETDYSGFGDDSVEIIYLGCQTTSSLLFTFLLVKQRESDSPYTRLGTLSVVLSRLDDVMKARRSLQQSDDHLSPKIFELSQHEEVMQFFRDNWQSKTISLA